MQTLQSYYEKAQELELLFANEPSRYDDDRNEYIDSTISKKIELIEWKLDQLSQEEERRTAKVDYQSEQEYAHNMGKLVANGAITQAQFDDLMAYHRFTLNRKK